MRSTANGAGRHRLPSEHRAVNLRAKRLEHGLTMQQLAERCTAAGASVSASEISRIERSIHIPRPALRKKLAELLGLTVEDFGDWPS